MTMPINIMNCKLITIYKLLETINNQSGKYKVTNINIISKRSKITYAHTFDMLKLLIKTKLIEKKTIQHGIYQYNLTKSGYKTLIAISFINSSIYK